MQQFIKILADGTLLLIIAIAAPITMYAIRHRFWRSAPIIVMAALTSLFVGKMLSLVYQPEVARPFLKIGATPGAAYIDNPGFPSDHALLATVAVVALYAVTKNKRIGIMMMGLVVMMCVGRVLALVHTPLDVIFGIIAGLSGFVWYKKLTK